MFTIIEGGTWGVEPGNMLVCERNVCFQAAVAMGDEPVQRPAGTVSLGAAPLEQDDWLQPNNAA
ncbi:hypothetical protein ABC337_03650 [Arthrobacter sp. 1P04PC]|uniref:hypothetical protein n=1 Tax=unclassified Arthrobacter TaxID=235627 RepID=UPI0039A15261